jgi:hypothetical protein
MEPLAKLLNHAGRKTLGMSAGQQIVNDLGDEAVVTSPQIGESRRGRPGAVEQEQNVARLQFNALPPPVSQCGGDCPCERPGLEQLATASGRAPKQVTGCGRNGPYPLIHAVQARRESATYAGRQSLVPTQLSEDLGCGIHAALATDHRHAGNVHGFLEPL